MMVKSVLIVGGGIAGWITAAYLARVLEAQSPDGVRITVLDSGDNVSPGLGEGTAPTIRNTLHCIGIDETSLVRKCCTSFKQGTKFVDWRYPPGRGEPDHYLHPFQISPQEPAGLDLLPYWLLGVAGPNVNWDAVNTAQKRVADSNRAPKLIHIPDYRAPLNYAYHFDALKLAALLRRRAIALGVLPVRDKLEKVNLTEDGSIRSVTGARGELHADLFIDCTGFGAQLIGAALGAPYKSCRSSLFCDTALAMQVPHEWPDSPIASCTIATAHDSGWISDIGLDCRREIGNVYSSDHTNDARAEATLRAYVGKAGDRLLIQKVRFDPGYREISWKKNCIAIGASSGFFEPLEATGSVFIEAAAALLANLFPWGGDLEIAAKQYNGIMRRRFERALDFIKMHYCISERRDSRFWLDNADSASIPESLQELLRMWRQRPPGPVDFDQDVDLFKESSWQYVLYGMGYETDLRPRAGALRHHAEARAAFATIRRQAEYRCQTLPTNRELLDLVRIRAFGEGAGRRLQA